MRPLPFTILLRNQEREKKKRRIVCVWHPATNGRTEKGKGKREREEEQSRRMVFPKRWLLLALFSSLLLLLLPLSALCDLAQKEERKEGGGEEEFCPLVTCMQRLKKAKELQKRVSFLPNKIPFVKLDNLNFHSNRALGVIFLPTLWESCLNRRNLLTLFRGTHPSLLCRLEILPHHSHSFPERMAQLYIPYYG